jgi:hypothetical protein
MEKYRFGAEDVWKILSTKPWCILVQFLALRIYQLLERLNCVTKTTVGHKSYLQPHSSTADPLTQQWLEEVDGTKILISSFQ